MEQARSCRVCGCTELNACRTDDGPCHWVESRLCSAPACAIHRRKITEADGPLLEKLPKEQREALQFDGSYQQAADHFAVALGTVKSRINRGRIALALLRDEALDKAGAA